jgi:hypothetical protein
MLVFTFMSYFSNDYIEVASLVSDGLHCHLSLLFNQESMEDDESLYAK